VLLALSSSSCGEVAKRLTAPALKATTCSALEATCGWTCACTARTAKGHRIMASAADGK